MIRTRVGRGNGPANLLFRGLVWAAVAALWLAARPAAASAERAAFEQQIMSEIQARSAEAATAFREGNDARDRGDMIRARDRYQEVRRLAPGFYHATRRLCSVEHALGHRAEAITLCREALAAADTPENLSALAGVLVSPPAAPGEINEGRRLSRKAVERAPRDPDVRSTDCSAALADEDLKDLRDCVAALQMLAPRAPSTHVFTMIAKATDGDLDEARAALDRARAEGLDRAEYDRLSGVLDRATPLYVRVLSTGWRVGVAWFAAFLLLLGLGSLLSRAALRAARRPPEGAFTMGSQAAPNPGPAKPGLDGKPAGLEKTLRRIYRVVLWLCCGFYYLSIPLLLIVTVVAGLGVIYACFAAGTIPIKLVLIVAVVTFTTVWAVAKSLFVRATRVDPGTRLDLAEHPRLHSVLAEVAAKIGTPAVDTVFLTPGTDVAVMERSEMRGLLRGASERCLILGAGVLRGMKVLELKSILAHEHGHFHNEDTAGGGFALAVRRSLFSMAIALARSGVAAWYNPVWLFLRAFNRVFISISHGASRLQEVLADRWAVRAYGSETFERGLRHVIRRSALFDAHVDATLNEVVSGKLPLQNLYTYKPTKRKDVDEEVEAVINAEPSVYDSHPAPKDRFTWAHALAVPAPEGSPEDAEPAWSLFSDRRLLEETMTDAVRAQILASHNVSIPRGAAKREAKQEANEVEAGESSPTAS